MPRDNSHLDAMLRHLGAAYYESLHGRATRADVMRALDTVEEHLNEHAGPDGPAGAGPARHRDREHAAASRGHSSVHSRGWSRRVSDVMTTSVITVDRITPYKEIARLLAENRISGVPVLKMGREVAGVVTEADLVAAQADAMRRLRAATHPSWLRRQRHPAVTAGELMTSPAVTIGPLATVPAAARLMSDHHVRRLPVVDEHGRLIGIVSRRDLLSVFLRPDEDIAADIRTVLDEVLAEGPDDAGVSVRNGIVTLTGTLDPNAGPHGDLIPVAIRLMWDIDGVVDIIDRLGASPPAAPAESAEPDDPDEPAEPAPSARTGPSAHTAG
jgi:CBS domain-containing protein